MLKRTSRAQIENSDFISPRTRTLYIATERKFGIFSDARNWTFLHTFMSTEKNTVLEDAASSTTHSNFEQWRRQLPHTNIAKTAKTVATILYSFENLFTIHKILSCASHVSVRNLN